MGFNGRENLRDPTSAYSFNSEVRHLNDAVPAFIASSMEKDGGDGMNMRLGGSCHLLKEHAAE